jgi:hypothetical protein
MSIRHGYWFVGCGDFCLAVYANVNGAFVELEEDARTTTRRVVSFDAASILEAAALLAANSNYPTMATSNYRDLEDAMSDGSFWRNF